MFQTSLRADGNEREVSSLRNIFKPQVPPAEFIRGYFCSVRLPHPIRFRRSHRGAYCCPSRVVAHCAGGLVSREFHLQSGKREGFSWGAHPILEQHLRAYVELLRFRTGALCERDRPPALCFKMLAQDSTTDNVLLPLLFSPVRLLWCSKSFSSFTSAPSSSGMLPA